MSHTPKVALVTGAARRVGAAIAKTLHAAGLNMVLHYNHSQADAQQLSADFNAKRPQSSIIFQAELTHVSECQNLVLAASEEWGRLDVLVNNASRFYKTFSRDVPETAWNDLMDSNLKAPFYLSLAVLTHLRKSQGCIINIADIHAERPMEDYSVYSISKAGLVMLTKSLAKEFGPEVRVNAVAPGSVCLPEGENTLTPEQNARIIHKTLLKRQGDPMDIAKAVLFLVRDADFITGQVIAVDGGRSLAL